MASDSGVKAGTSAAISQALCSGPATDKLPDIAVETRKLLLTFKKACALTTAAIDFQFVFLQWPDWPVAHRFFMIIARHNFGFKIIEGQPVAFAFVQNR